MLFGRGKPNDVILLLGEVDRDSFGSFHNLPVLPVLALVQYSTDRTCVQELKPPTNPPNHWG